MASGPSQRAAIYVRVSSAGQEEDGTSLQTQEQRCRDIAAEHGYTVAGVYRDVQTGAMYRERPGLTTLRRDVHAGLVQIVIAYAIDRLSRNQAHLYILAEEFTDHRVQLEFVTESFEDSAVGRFIRAAKAFAAEVEREKIAERSVRGRKARVEAGKRLPSRNMLYGYRWRDDQHEALDIDPVTGPVVQRIFRESAMGTSLRTISAQLMRDGIPAPQGGAAWGLSTINRILARRDYTGDAIGWAYKDGGRHYRPEEGIPLPAGSVPALVDETTWEIVRQRLIHNKQEAARNNRSPEATLLRGGVARCGYCGRALRVTHRSGPKQIGQLDYRCGGKQWPGSECPGPMIPVALLDTATWGQIQRMLREPEVWIRGFRQLPQDDPVADELARIDAADAELATRQQNLARGVAVVNDAHAATPLLAELSAIAGRRQHLESERRKLQDAQRGWTVAQQQLDALVSWCRSIDVDALGYAERRRVIDMLGLSVTVYRKEHRPRWAIESRPFSSPIVFPLSRQQEHNRDITLRWTDADVKEAAD